MGMRDSSCDVATALEHFSKAASQQYAWQENWKQVERREWDLAKLDRGFAEPIVHWAVSLSLTLGLCAGWAKGRFVLSKTALRNKRRLQRLEGPRPWQIFSPGGFYPLIMLMVGMSIGLKKVFGTGFGGGMVTYGGIVTGIGSGLLVSSFAYWFESYFVKSDKMDACTGWAGAQEPSVSVQPLKGL
eukprot:Skav208318  [mRNA]  locus=scaffold897:601625:611538:+ [translate_table: standard]